MSLINHSFTFGEIDFGKILTKLIQTDTITDIMLWEKEIWVTDIVKGHYRYEAKKASKEDLKQLEELLYKIPRQIAIRMQVAYNEGSPLLDGEALLENGQLRISAIHESLCGGIYPGIALRKTRYRLRISEKMMVEEGFADQNFINLLKNCIDAGCNVIIAGETGSGKTELLKFLSRYIRDNEAVITMEDTLEAYLKRLYPSKNILSLKTSEHYDFCDLLRSCLRQNPDWICVSETRGQEVKQLCEAVGTGHKLISTIHADSATRIPYRMVDMAQVQGIEAERLFNEVHHNIDIGIYIHYYNDKEGSHRQIAECCEFYVDEDNKPRSHLLYKYDYEKKKYVYDLIQSPQIRLKLLRKNTDCHEMEGVYL